jgi:thioredoxin 1
MSEHVLAVSDGDFEKTVLQSTVPVLVDFWAPWCSPCRMLMPTIENLAEEYEGKLKIVKMNVDENTETPAKYSVRGIPTLLIFKNGNLFATKVGAVAKPQLITFLDDALKD